MDELNKKLQALHDALADVLEVEPIEDCDSEEWEELFAECHNLQEAFEAVGTENGVVPEFQE